MKYIKKILKNIIISSITIYSFNIILVKLGYFLPINYFSLLTTSILGFPGLIIYGILAYKFYW